MPERVPAGRAGRLWLLERLDAARRGTDLLDRKRQLLRREFDRLRLLVEARRRELGAAYAEAERWGTRAALLAGEEGIALVARPLAGRAQIDVTWRNTMGVIHPEDAHCRFPDVPPLDAAASSAALAPAAQAYRRALAAAVAVAVADEACERVGSELQATQRRLRAIQRHRIPELQAALMQLESTLDELEREERVVARWAQRRRGAR